MVGATENLRARPVLLDPRAFPTEAFADLYRRRWAAELGRLAARPRPKEFSCTRQAVAESEHLTKYSGNVS